MWILVIVLAVILVLSMRSLQPRDVRKCASLGEVDRLLEELWAEWRTPAVITFMVGSRPVTSKRLIGIEKHGGDDRPSIRIRLARHPDAKEEAKSFLRCANELRGEVEVSRLYVTVALEEGVEDAHKLVGEAVSDWFREEWGGRLTVRFAGGPRVPWGCSVGGTTTKDGS